jgi:hypothetical protein
LDFKEYVSSRVRSILKTNKETKFPNIPHVLFESHIQDKYLYLIKVSSTGKLVCFSRANP